MEKENKLILINLSKTHNNKIKQYNKSFSIEYLFFAIFVLLQVIFFLEIFIRISNAKNGYSIYFYYRKDLIQKLSNTMGKKLKKVKTLSLIHYPKKFIDSIFFLFIQ